MPPLCLENEDSRSNDSKGTNHLSEKDFREQIGSMCKELKSSMERTENVAQVRMKKI